MASSGSFNFTVTRDEIINLAHQHIGAIGEGETCTAAQITEASKLLNMIVKLRHADGMPLWTIKTAYILPNNNFFVNVGPDVDWTSNNQVVDDDFWTRLTTLSSSASAGANSVTIANNAMSNGENIGIEQDDGSVHWTTVSSSAGFVVGLTTPLTIVASTGNTVYGYANADRIQAMPLRILGARTYPAILVNNNVGSLTEMEIITREEYLSLQNKLTKGTPSQLFYFPYEPYIDKSTAPLGNLDGLPEGHGVIHYYPIFTDGKSIIEFQFVRPFQDFDAATDTPDFPQAFHLPLMLELAAMIGPKFGLPMDERVRLFREAESYRQEALTTVYPEGSLKIQPDDEGAY